MQPISYARHQIPPADIQHAIWLYLRFTLSYRDVEDLLAERGLDLSYETVRRWVLKFGHVIARRLRDRVERAGSADHTPRTVAGAPGSAVRVAPGVVCVVSGHTAMVSFPDLPGRVSLEEIERHWPDLLPGLVDHDGVGFLLVSLDPQRDTPGRLAEWAKQSALDDARWTLLSGDDGAVRELAATLGVRYQVQPDGEVAHTNAITVLDASGRVAHQQTGLGDADGETRRAVAALLR